MIYVDAHKNVITKGSKVKCIMPPHDDTTIDDIYIIKYILKPFSRICVTSIRTGYYYTVHCSNIERVFEDPREFIEALPI